MISPARLGHCTTLTRHSLLCDRDGTYCGLDGAHRGPCKPHGDRPRSSTSVTIQRLTEESGEPVGWIVDAHDPGLFDTSSRFYTTEERARDFARELADLLIAGEPVELEDELR
jgi:hypothetical protein